MPDFNTCSEMQGCPITSVFQVKSPAAVEPHKNQIYFLRYLSVIWVIYFSYWVFVHWCLTGTKDFDVLAAFYSYISFKLYYYHSIICEFFVI